MNGYDELDAWLENGVDENYFEGTDEFFQESYLDQGDEFFGESSEGYQGAAFSNKHAATRSSRPPAPPTRSGVSPAQIQRAVRQIQMEIARMKRVIAASNRISNPTGLARKLKELEDSIASMQNNQLMETLLGQPKLDEVTFQGETAKKVENSSYEFPIFRLLQNSGKKGLDFNNNLLPLLLFSRGQDSSLKNAFGGNDSLLMFYFLSNSMCKK